MKESNILSSIIILYLCIFKINGCMVRCLQCKDTEKRVYPFNKEHEYREGCFNEMEVEKKNIKKCFKHFGDQRFNCIMAIIIDIHLDQFSNTLNNVAATKVTIERSCYDKKFQAVIKNSRFNVIIDNGIHRSTQIFGCNQPMCNTIHASEFKMKNFIKFMRFCVKCSSIVTNGAFKNKGCYNFRKKILILEQAPSFFICTGICYTTMHYNNGKAVKFERGCYVNKDSLNYNYLSTINDDEQYLILPLGDRVQLIDFCLHIPSRKMCNIRKPTLSLSEKMYKENSNTKYHQCMYCISKTDTNCINGVISNNYFDRILCNGKCYSIVIKNKIIRSCIAPVFYVVGKSENYLKSDMEYSSDEIAKGCYQLNNIKICQELCDGIENPFCNVNAKDKVEKFKSVIYTGIRINDSMIDGAIDRIPYEYSKKHKKFETQKTIKPSLKYLWIAMILVVYVIIATIIYKKTFGKKEKVDKSKETSVVSVYDANSSIVA